MAATTRNRINQGRKFKQMTISVDAEKWEQLRKLNQMTGNKINWSAVAQDAFDAILANEHAFLAASVEQKEQTQEVLDALEKATNVMLSQLQQRYFNDLTTLYDTLLRIQRAKQGLLNNDLLSEAEVKNSKSLTGQKS